MKLKQVFYKVKHIPSGKFITSPIGDKTIFIGKNGKNFPTKHSVQEFFTKQYLTVRNRGDETITFCLEDFKVKEYGVYELKEFSI